MSELPDLPRPVRRTRPLPPGGLEAVMRSGRRRRTAFLGAAGGAMTAVALVAAVVLTAAEPRAEGLQFADPTPAVTVASGEPTPTTSAAVASPEPTASATPQPNEEGATPSTDPSPRPSPEQSDHAAQPPPQPEERSATQREPYTESPREVDAPATCRQPPSGSAGPVFYGGGSACASGSTSESTVKRGGRVTGTTDLCLAHGGRDAVLGWDSGREHEVSVETADGSPVYRFSATVDYTQGAHQRSLAAGRCLTWTGVWDTTYTNGDAVPAGQYRVRISVGADSVNGERRPASAAVEFSVTVE